MYACNLLSTLCPSTAPNAKSLASHMISNDKFQLGVCKIEEEVNSSIFQSIKSMHISINNDKRDIFKKQISQGQSYL